MAVNWQQVIGVLVLLASGILTGGVGVAVVNGLFRKTPEAVQMWRGMAIDFEERLRESEKNSRKLSAQLELSRTEMQELRTEIRAGVEVFKRCMPMLERVADETELLELNGAVKRFQRLGTTKRGR